MNTYKFYQAYGLCIKSTKPIDNLVEMSYSNNVPSDMHIEFLNQELKECEAGKLLYASSGKNIQNINSFRVWQISNGDVHIRYNNGKAEVLFIVFASGKKIDVLWSKGMLWGDINTFLIGPVLGIALRVQGKTCLHGSAVDVGGRAIIIIGRKGMGKSTLTAFFAQKEYPILTDDIAVLYRENGQFWVSPGYPCLRVCPNTIHVLEEKEFLVEKLPKVLFEFEKYYLPLHINSLEIAWRFQTQSLPIVGVYYLCRSTDERVKVECISQQNGLIDLTRNVYGYYLSNNNVCDFKILGELITKIPAYRFFYPHKLEILPQIFANILEHSTNSLPHPS